MAKKTSFQQVSLEVVKEAIEQADWNEPTESGRGTKKEVLEQILLAINGVNEKGIKS